MGIVLPRPVISHTWLAPRPGWWRSTAQRLAPSSVAELPLVISPDFLCPHCQVKKHVRSFHSEKIYQCTECDKAFCRPDKLRLHMLRHSDRKDFLCSTCGKQFKVGSSKQPGCSRATETDKLRMSLRISWVCHLCSRNRLEMYFVPHVWLTC